MKPQFITTERGEELVVIARHDYYDMLARLGDENAKNQIAALIPSGARIRAVRRSSGFSQASLAESAGIAQGYLSEIEADRKKPTIEIVERICQALNISVGTL